MYPFAETHLVRLESRNKVSRKKKWKRKVDGESAADVRRKQRSENDDRNKLHEYSVFL